MIKMVAAVRRKPGMTHAECLHYIEHVHGEISKAKPLGLQKYMQNHVFDSAFGAESDVSYSQVFHRDSVTELYFEDFPGVIRTFTDPYTQEKVGPDGPNFADPTMAAQLMTEAEVAVSKPGQATIKVLHFLKKAADKDLQAFFSAWQAAHEHAQQHCTDFAAAVRKHVRAEYIPEGDKVTAYFGPEIEVHHGVASMWFESEGDLSAFRSYQRVLTKKLAEEGVLDPHNSFFLYAKEVPIIG